MIRDVSDADVLTFLRAGCNAAEIAAYAGCTLAVAEGWIAHLLFARHYTTPIADAELYDRRERGYVEYCAAQAAALSGVAL